MLQLAIQGSVSALALLLYVLPSLAMNDSADNAYVNAKFIGKGLLRDVAFSVASADFSNAYLGQFGPRAAFTKEARTPLPRHIGHVLSVRAQPQMLDVDTQGIVAARTVVKDAQAIRDRSASNLPGVSVSEKVLSALFHPMDVAVSVFVASAGPQNASCRGWLAESFAENNINSNVPSSPLTWTRAEFTNPTLDLGNASAEVFAAVTTDAFNSSAILTWHTGPPTKVQV